MTLSRNLLMSATAVALLAGCTMVPDYMRPDAPVASNWPVPKADDLSGQAQKSATDVTWQEFFRSPVLQKVIATALDNNRDLRIAALNIEEARAQYRIQRADLVPSVNGGLSGSRQRIPDDLSPTGKATTGSQYDANVAVTAFELDLFGRIRSLNEGALEDYLATEEARNATQIALIAETANVYLQLLADQKTLRLTQETLATQQQSYDLIAKTNELGAATGLDLAQASTAVETAKANLALYTRLVAQDKNALVLLMGTGDAGALSETETLESVLLMDNLPVGLPSEVLLLRPDIRQAEHSLKGANARIGAARAAFFPTISLTGSAGFASDSLGDLFTSGGAGAWSFLPRLTMPIFEGGRNIANLDVAEARKEISVAQYEKAIQVAFREVADELVARATLTDQLQAQRGLVAAAQKSYDLSQARYKQGIDNYLVALDSQRALYVAQQNEIIVEQQYLANLVNLYKTLGGGAR
jgi:multidrug efflux system outer membrane protein